MNELIKVNDAEIEVKEYRGQRVVTFKDIDLVHGRPEGTARRNFNSNKSRFIESEDYFIVGSDEIRTSHIMTISDNDFMNKALITEQGYLMLVKSFTDDLAWQVQRQLVNSYFKVRNLVDDLSPRMQMLYGMLDQMAETERRAREAKEIAQKAIDTTEAIKDAVQPITENWRETVNTKFNRIQNNCNVPFSYLRNEMYKELESRAGCNLTIRLENKKERMRVNGSKGINQVNRMDVIEEDKRLREIFSKIVCEYEIKYCA